MSLLWHLAGQERHGLKPPMDSLNKYASQKLAAIKAKGLYRRTIPTFRSKNAKNKRDGKTYISFSGNDYLGLTHHKQVIAAAQAATGKYGAGAGASRLVTGNHPLYTDLEAKIAAFKRAEAACVFGSGYLTNLGVIPCLVDEGDLIIADRLCHACIFAGSTLSKARLKIFRHNDLDHLRNILESHRPKARHALILTDGVFSMDGDRAPVAGLATLAREFDAWLMTDDAHGLGVVEDGRGTSFHSAHKLDVPLQMGTLSKAVGAYGGYIAADKPVIDMIKNTSRALIYTTALPPGTVAAAIKGLEIIERNKKLCTRPVKKAALFCAELGLPEPESAIVAIILGEPEVAVHASKTLAEEGFLVAAIRPPTVPEGTARLRFAFKAVHKDADIIAMTQILKKQGIVK